MSDCVCDERVRSCRYADGGRRLIARKERRGIVRVLRRDIAIVIEKIDIASLAVPDSNATLGYQRGHLRHVSAAAAKDSTDELHGLGHEFVAGDGVLEHDAVVEAACCDVRKRRERRDVL